jgi:hypothetical protein
MRQGIATRYIGPTDTKGGRIKAIARKRSSIGAEMSLTRPYSYSGIEREHTTAAAELATKLGWSGYWIGAGNPDEDGYQYVNIPSIPGVTRAVTPAFLGEAGVDWFFVPDGAAPPEKQGCLATA